MSSKIQPVVKAGAVPEHFFYPWKKWLTEAGGSSRWRWLEYPGGSGDMIRALNEKELDLAFLLTESALQAISKGSDFEILSIFVKSPLQWGIFTGASNPIQHISEGKTYAISRFSSGSHLMAMLEAAGRDFKIVDKQWKIVSNLEGAKKALVSGEADLFFWERWTGSPLVDSGEFRMLGVFPGPWPAFVLCARKDCCKYPGFLDSIKEDFLQVSAIAEGIKQNQEAFASEIAEHYHLKPKAAIEWLKQVQWVSEFTRMDSDLDAARKILAASKIISP